MWQLVMADHLLAAKAGSGINWQDVITDVLLAGTAAAAIWLNTLNIRLLKQGRAELAEAQNARFDQQRPVLLPSIGGHPLEVKNVLGFPAGLYPDLRADHVSLVITNIGTGPALAVRGILYGPAPADQNDVRSWRSFYGVSSIRSGEGPTVELVVGGIDVPGNAVVGKEKKYTLYAPPLPDPTQFLSRVAPWSVARLTITYHDIFGRKHASMFDYTERQEWRAVDEGFFPEIPQALEDVELEHARPASPPAFLPAPTGPSQTPRQMQA